MGVAFVAMGPSDAASQTFVDPEVVEIRFEGNDAFPDSDLGSAILTDATRCRTFLFVFPLIFFGVLLNSRFYTQPAKRNAIFATAYGADQEFFAFYRSLTAYENSLKGTNSTIVLSPDSEFFNYLNSDKLPSK